MLENLNLGNSTGMNKSDVIQMILMGHPQAQLEEESEEIEPDEAKVAPAARKRKRDKQTPLDGMDNKLIDNFMTSSKRPKFSELFTEHHGVGQMYDILAATFNASSRSQPESKAFWAAICISLYNTYTLWAEQQASSLQSTGQVNQAAAEPVYPPSRFFVELVLEIVQHCQNLQESAQNPTDEAV